MIGAVARVICGIAVATVLGAGVAMSTKAGPPVLGGNGDSLSDEYAEGDYRYALNWVQQLVLFREVLEFGPTATQAGRAATNVVSSDLGSRGS